MKTKIIKGALLFFIAVCMLLVWPVSIVRREVSDRSGDGYGVTEKLGQGMSFSQHFLPKESRLKSIDFVFTFEEELPREGEFLFEVLNEEGEAIYTGRIPYGVFINYNFYRVPVDLKLNKNKIYTYRVSNTNVTENPPRVVYTEEPSMHVEEARGMLFQDLPVEGEAMTQFVWKAPLDFVSVLASWSFLAIGGFAALELADHFAKKKTKAESGENK